MDSILQGKAHTGLAKSYLHRYSLRYGRHHLLRGRLATPFSSSGAYHLFLCTDTLPSSPSHILS